MSQTRINRRDALKAIAGGAAAAAAPRWASSQAPSGKRPPNILYFILDEWGYYEMSGMGNDKLLTPNIDRVAVDGMRFTQMLAGAPVCAPTRSTLMTGKHMGHTSVRGNAGGEALRAEDVTIAQVLRDAGYAVGGFGKWGLGDRGTTGVPENHGFDIFYGYYHQVHAHSFFPNYLLKNSEKVPLEGNTGDFKTGRQFSQYLIFEEAKRFIRENKDRPFFCYCPWTPPHGRWGIPADDPSWQLFKDKDWGDGGVPEDARIYAAMVHMNDRQIGEILEMLDEFGLAGNTIVFVSGDNGGKRYFGNFFDPNRQFRGEKGLLYEGGLRVQYIVRWPGQIAPGSVSDHLGYFPDVFPTLAELAGVSIPAGIDGISFVPSLLGEEKAGRRQEQHPYLYWEYNGATAVRLGDWKAVRPAPRRGVAAGPFELYNLAEDISETANVAAEHPDIIAKIEAIAREAHAEHINGDYVPGGKELAFQNHQAK